MPFARRSSLRSQRIAEALDAARRRHNWRDFQGELGLYCDNSDCPCEEITVRVDEFEDPTPAGLVCNACHKPVQLRYVRTRSEAQAEHEREARMSVNMQLRNRDNPGSMRFCTWAELNDDSLLGSPAKAHDNQEKAGT